MGNCCQASINEPIPNIFSTDISKVDRYTYADQYKYARFDNIYDGDTADIYFLDNQKIIRSQFRFYGYDSAEMKPLKKLENRKDIVLQAINDKEYLTSLIINRKCVVKFMKNEKYGRMMGIVWKINNDNIPEDMLSTHPELIESNNICNIMINSGHGNIYYGGSKEFNSM